MKTEEKKEMILKSIKITNEQNIFIDETALNLSKFVRIKIQELIEKQN